MTFDVSGVPSGLPVGDRWVTGLPLADVHFPYDGSVVAQAPVADVPTARAALEAGLAAVGPTGSLTAGRRRAVLVAVERELAARHDELVELLIAESGKPRVDCEVELARTLFTWSAAAEAVGQIHGETMPIDLQPAGEGMFGYWVRKPIGLVIGIAGFNYPLLLASHKIAPAIAAGCPVICKPAPSTPLTTLILADVVRRALAEQDAPVSAVQVVTGDATVGGVLTSDPRIGAVSFTGSAGVGHQIARDAAPRKALLELGSNAALIVDADVDLDKAVDAVFRGAFYGSGQACISVQRVLVLDAVREAFLARLAERVPTLATGDPRLPETRVAALIDERSTQRVLTWIRQAEEAGAKVLTGGVVDDGAIEPTVLVDAPEDALVWCEEVFGPVVAVRSVPDLDAAIAAVNRSRYGLQASVYTRSLAAAMTVIDRLEVGGVVVNEVPGFRSDIQPYGGVKDSGIGREGPRFAIEELTVTRTAVIRPS
jgi:acyl-CoA reductase-like NAD-dependent aldehyde dehydrogenase